MNRLISVLALLTLSTSLLAQEKEPGKEKKGTTAKGQPAEKSGKSALEEMTDLPMSVESLVEQVRPSLAAISVVGRDGTEQGVGTGFVISEDGLIVTNMHVIGEGREFSVELSDGKKLDAEAIHAWDRNMDLAVIKVKASGLRPLKLADEAQAKPGIPIVVMGNPHGYRNSVVAGVLSSNRVIDDREMMQLAIAVEPGNSGGPVITTKGEVLGVVSMKSLVTRNLGFAISVKFVKQLLAKPNRVSLKKWRTIGSIDPGEWKVLANSKWRQQGGKIIADGYAGGIAGRALCISAHAPPKLPYEFGVYVKLDDESGAAGLVIHSNKKDKHYGFYPSAGRLRLTRFDGPNVFTWKVLRDEPSPHYKVGELNHLKVRVEKDRFLCFVNDKLVYESSDKVYQNGSIGLCKFRDTKAIFTTFRVRKKLKPTQLSEMDKEKLNNSIDALPKLEDFAESDIKSLVASPMSTSKLIALKARELEERAQELRQYADDVHRRAIAQAIAKSIKGKDEEIDLLEVCLLIANLDDREIDVDGYQKQLARMVNEVKNRFKKGTSEADKLKEIGKYLFKEQGFHGSRFDYYHRANSYMNRVIDDREGLPITLSVLYMEFARHLGMNVEGVGLPGHFVVRFQPKTGDGQLVDVFNGGKFLSRDDAEKIVWNRAQTLLKKEHLEKSTRRAILTRVLRNLIGAAQNEGAKERLLGYLEVYMVLDPEAVAERGLRAMTRFETGRRQAAIRDLDWFIEKEPPGLDLNKIQQLRNFFQFRDPPKPQK